jgi:hypothetical protein
VAACAAGSTLRGCGRGPASSGEQLERAKGRQGRQTGMRKQLNEEAGALANSWACSQSLSMVAAVWHIPDPTAPASAPVLCCGRVSHSCSGCKAQQRAGPAGQCAGADTAVQAASTPIAGTPASAPATIPEGRSQASPWHLPGMWTCMWENNSQQSCSLGENKGLGSTRMLTVEGEAAVLFIHSRCELH